MKGKYSKSILLAIFAVFLVIAFILLAIFAKYSSLSPEENIDKLLFSRTNQSEIRLGEPIKFNSEIRTSWKIIPRRIELSLPEGLQEIGTKKFHLKSIRWGAFIWQVEIILQAFRCGDYGEISGSAEFSTKQSTKLESPFSLPSFSVKEIQVSEGQEIKIAGKIEKKSPFDKKAIFVIFAIILIAVIIAFAIFAVKKRNKEKNSPLPFWCFTLDALRELRISQERGLLGVQLCVAKLCDIIRDYLEKRFAIDAPTMTTQEFLESLKKETSPLGEKDKKFLSDFMLSAELVKFANFPADAEIVEKAISDAERLVKESVPADISENAKNRMDERKNEI